MNEPAHRSIGEVLASLSGEFPDVTISKIRFLESQGLIAPERTPSGYRKFYDDDVARLRWILVQQKDHFLPLKVIKDRLDEHDRDGSPLPDVVDAPSDVADPPEVERPVDAPAKPKRTRSRATRQKAARAEPLSGTQLALDGGADDLVGVSTGVSLTRTELAAAAELDVEGIRELEAYGLIAPAGRMGEEGLFDEDALAVTLVVARLMRLGAEPRHLRMFRNFAEREAALYEGLALGVLRPRGEASVTRSRDAVVELADLGRSLRTLYLRRALDRILRAEARGANDA
ncbi:MAG: MerR family transcriptional regulator [Actinomycetes bacterium]